MTRLLKVPLTKLVGAGAQRRNSYTPIVAVKPGAGKAPDVQSPGAIAAAAVEAVGPSTPQAGAPKTYTATSRALSTSTMISSSAAAIRDHPRVTIKTAAIMSLIGKCV